MLESAIAIFAIGFIALLALTALATQFLGQWVFKGDTATFAEAPDQQLIRETEEFLSSL